MSKHTLGPWRVDPYCSTRIETAEPDATGNRMHIADVRGWGHLTGHGGRRMSIEGADAVQRAHARLIAAAPQLLDALKAKVRVEYSSNPHEHSRVDAEVRALIAEVEGDG